ncbi:MAG: sigma-70 family RNA polymerase sigma factor [Bacteroidales bacterium]|jgi:RNA polymerase sigma-70 factor (ECF subfamily)|nr:sigma-70 family RNA polymerase sigma factor [Bacteroidales bacterium]
MKEDFLTEAFVSMKDRWKAEDALQEAFCRLWGRKYKVSSLKEAIGLLARTGRNIEIDEFRKSRGRKTVGLDKVGMEDDPSAAMALEREALFRKVEASLDRDITLLQKKIIQLHEYEGLSFEEIAKELGMQPAAVRMQASRARKLLRDKFRNDDGTDR